jgi:ABC-type bacteriocin/lantibiotic exporter with double-glycine peptidase domain
MEQQASVSRRMQESLSATPLIKAFASEDREVGHVMSELRAVFHITLERVAVGSLANLTVSALSDVAKLVVLVVGAYEVIVGRWSLGSLLAFQAYHRWSLTSRSVHPLNNPPLPVDQPGRIQNCQRFRLPWLQPDHDLPL